MNVSLTPRLEDFVRRQVASGLYNNASEVVREALRQMVELRAEAGARTALPTAGSVIRARLSEAEAALRDRGVVSLALFGSVARGDERPDSDVDILVGIDPTVRFSLVDHVALATFLEARLGRPVDLATREGLDSSIRDRVLREAERIF